MVETKLDAALALRSGDKLLVGRDRIRLLEAVAKCGSINKAAKEAGFSYKTAWDAVNSINNLLPKPAFVTKTGGKTGGGAEITAEGRSLIQTFRRLEERLQRISALMAENGVEDQDELLLWLLGMRISTRNVFQAEAVALERGPVRVAATLRISENHRLMSFITNAAADDLNLTPGKKLLALIKAPCVALIEASGGERTDQENYFEGEIVARTDDDLVSEIEIAIGAGKTLVSVSPRAAIDALDAKIGARMAARFDPAQVILAAN